MKNPTREARRSKLQKIVEELNNSSDECMMAAMELDHMKLEDLCGYLRDALAHANMEDAAAEGDNSANFRDKREEFDKLIDRANEAIDGGRCAVDAGFGVCADCGTKLILSDGWHPTYNDPDNAGSAPTAEPMCPKCEADLGRENLRNYEPMSRSSTVMPLGLDTRRLDALLELDIDVKPAEGGGWVLVDWRENPPRTTEHKTGRDAIDAALSSPNSA